MRLSLHAHPILPSGAIGALAADARRGPGGRLELVFEASAVTEALVVPPPAPGARADGLWRHTCFEAFVRAGDGPGYVELNLSPSGHWAAYQFGDYREGMANAEVPPPGIRVEREGDRLILAASLDLSAALPPEAPWRASLTAVIEGQGGRMSYFALAHPEAKPDFHHADGFVLDLPVPEPA